MSSKGLLRDGPRVAGLLVPGLLALGLCIHPARATGEPQVLATVAKLQVTSRDLEAALASSPFSEKFAAMDEDDQAGLRGDLLHRLVAARLYTLEARRTGLDRSPAYVEEVSQFRRGLLYRRYMDRLRERIEVPEETLSAMRQQFGADREGMNAARSAWVSERYRLVKAALLVDLGRREHLRAYPERMQEGVSPDTVLLESDRFQVRVRDIVEPARARQKLNPEWVQEQLAQRGELLLVSGAAEREGLDVEGRVRVYEGERLPALLLEGRSREWLADESLARDYYARHPEVSRIPERRHVGQLVLASREQALAARARILAGESLFQIAGTSSIDPQGRARNGDIGWMEEGRGLPELDRALDALADGEVSEVIETGTGFHLLTVVERRPGSTRSYEEVRERIRQILLDQKLPAYLSELEGRFPVAWSLPARHAGAAPATSPK